MLEDVGQKKAWDGMFTPLLSGDTSTEISSVFVSVLGYLASGTPLKGSTKSSFLKGSLFKSCSAPKYMCPKSPVLLEYVGLSLTVF